MWFGLALFGLAAIAGAQEPPPAHGVIPRLSAEAYEQAKACGRAGAECATTPYQLCPSESERYQIRIATPFSRVASSMFEGVKAGKPGRVMERSNANRWGTGVYVLPAERSMTAAGIERLEIRREGRAIQPLTTTVGPIAVPMPDGSSRQIARGYFAFPPETFAPSGDITLVLTGSSGQHECLLDRARLETLR
jgi:hypothetical protein